MRQSDRDLLLDWIIKDITALKIGQLTVSRSNKATKLAMWLLFSIVAFAVALWWFR